MTDTLADLGFTATQIQALRTPIADKLVSKRKGANRQELRYVESWLLVDQANAIFGEGAWRIENVRKTIRSDIVVKKTVTRDGSSTQVDHRQVVTDIDFTLVVVTPTGREISRYGSGVADADAPVSSPRAAYEMSAAKAEAKALVRALRTFGPGFGSLLERDAEKVRLRPTITPSPVSGRAPTTTRAAVTPPAGSENTVALAAASNTSDALLDRCRSLKARISATRSMAEHSSLAASIADDVAQIAASNAEYGTLLRTYLAQQERAVRLADTITYQITSAQDTSGLTVTLSLQQHHLKAIAEANPDLRQHLDTLVANRRALLDGRPLRDAAWHRHPSARQRLSVA
jgi:Rad52/22 family double-strand break repair protein